MIRKYRIPIVIGLITIATSVGVLWFVLGVSARRPAENVAGPTVRLTDDFTLNLADTDRDRYIKATLAVQLAPMRPDDLKLFNTAEPTGVDTGTGSTPIMMSGKDLVASDPQLRDAVIGVVTQYTAEELLTADGKQKLKSDLMSAFSRIEREAKDAAGSGRLDPRNPPYHVRKIYFENYAIE